MCPKQKTGNVDFIIDCKERWINFSNSKWIPFFHSWRDHHLLSGKSRWKIFTLHGNHFVFWYTVEADLRKVTDHFIVWKPVHEINVWWFHLEPFTAASTYHSMQSSYGSHRNGHCLVYVHYLSPESYFSGGPNIMTHSNVYSPRNKVMHICRK